MEESESSKSTTLRFSEGRSGSTPPVIQASSRQLPTLQPRRSTKTSKLENLVLSDPSRVRVFRKIIDRQSGKLLYKNSKFKITQITDTTSVTDKGKVYRKTMFALSLTFVITFQRAKTH